MTDNDSPIFEFHVTGPFPGKSLGEVNDLIVDSLHDWLNSDSTDVDSCCCEFVVTARIVDDPIEEETV